MIQKRITLYFYPDEYDFVSAYCENEKISMNRYFQDWVRDQMKIKDRSKIDRIKIDTGVPDLPLGKPVTRVWKTKDEIFGVVKNKFDGLCQHGAMKGLCKQGCK